MRYQLVGSDRVLNPFDTVDPLVVAQTIRGDVGIDAILVDQAVRGPEENIIRGVKRW